MLGSNQEHDLITTSLARGEVIKKWHEFRMFVMTNIQGGTGFHDYLRSWSPQGVYWPEINHRSRN